MKFLGRYSATCYFVLKGFVLFALYVVTTLNGGMDLISRQPSNPSPTTVLELALACLFLAAPIFAYLESLK